jgi:hypothetical protein
MQEAWAHRDLYSSSPPLTSIPDPSMWIPHVHMYGFRLPEHYHARDICAIDARFAPFAASLSGSR